MRIACSILVLVLLCTTGVGCSLFKKNTNGTNGAAGGAGREPAKFPGVQDPLFPNSPPPPPTLPQPPAAPANPGAAANAGMTILAGTVMDSYHRPVGNAYIRWVSLEEKDTGAPIDVAADAGGHFIIQGVKPGAAYKLIARTKAGEKMLAGTVLTSAPNVRVVIPIREDIANTAPPLPGNPAYQGGPDKSDGANRNGGQANSVKPGGDQNLPATMTVPAPPADPKFIPGIADGAKKDRGLPLLRMIPGKQPPPIVPNDPPPPSFGPKSVVPTLPKEPGVGLDTGPTRVPSCALVGRRLANLALRDTKGQVWEYRKIGQGKIVLLDFWGTHCIHCPAMMPTLTRLHTQYGSRGLEVIGIALEEGKDERKDIDRVTKVCTSRQASYRQLLGHVGSFDAGQHFSIKGLPTLILLDESGDIIFHYVGRPEANDWTVLERMIQHRLNNRAF